MCEYVSERERESVCVCEGQDVKATHSVRDGAGVRSVRPSVCLCCSALSCMRYQRSSLSFPQLLERETRRALWEERLRRTQPGQRGDRPRRQHRPVSLSFFCLYRDMCVRYSTRLNDSCLIASPPQPHWSTRPVAGVRRCVLSTPRRRF